MTPWAPVRRRGMNTTSYYNETLRKFALGRLERTAARRQEKAREIRYLRELGALTDDESPYTCQLRLMDRAVYSIYLDCIDAGEGEAAREVLDGLRMTGL